jgi:hypothetical protein
MGNAAERSVNGEQFAGQKVLLEISAVAAERSAKGEQFLAKPQRRKGAKKVNPEVGSHSLFGFLCAFAVLREMLGCT